MAPSPKPRLCTKRGRLHIAILSYPRFSKRCQAIESIASHSYESDEIRSWVRGMLDTMLDSFPKNVDRDDGLAVLEMANKYYNTCTSDYLTNR
jgi:hypothetical protein